LDAGDHPSTQQRQQDQGGDAEAKLVAVGRSGGLVDPQQPADEELGGGA
jgi:hypothetical protein